LTCPKDGVQLLEHYFSDDYVEIREAIIETAEVQDFIMDNEASE